MLAYTLLEGGRRANVDGGQAIVEVHNDVHARVDPRAVRVHCGAVLRWPRVDHPAPDDDNRRVVPEVEETALLSLLAEADDEGIDHVQVLRGRDKADRDQLLRRQERMRK